jgi:PPOX class probable F420-dependent enzyme
MHIRKIGGGMSTDETGRRGSVRLTSDEAWSVLAEAHTGILTTLRRDGTPITLPTWFVAIDRQIYLRTPAQTKKVARLRRNPRVAFLVESGERWAELEAVHVTGRAEFLSEDSPFIAKVEAGLEQKYSAFRTSQSDMPERTRDHYTKYGSAYIRIVPDERILSWDNSRLGTER